MGISYQRYLLGQKRPTFNTLEFRILKNELSSKTATHKKVLIFYFTTFFMVNKISFILNDSKQKEYFF